jgi:phosphopantothenoylcysteine decarboxylase/phosphopantothenate--cysteine ligase
VLQGKRILIGIGGGIAVYRVAELSRMLIKAGMQVRCVMTRSACEFVTPMTFEALTGEQIHTELFDLTSEREMGHIKLARWADVVLIAPATASLLARLAHGVADDLLTTIMQVCEKPVLLAPAMNTSMWESAATQNNIATLKQYGLAVVGPESGELACGESGAGRLSELPSIISALQPLLSEQALSGQRWVINAGPTVEAWDEVRILSNRASGTLGALLADIAAIHGADISLIAGPGTPETHPLVKRFDIESAVQMLAACEKEAAGANIFIGTAAISDFRFAKTHQGKLKRENTRDLTVALTANPDIIASIAAMENRPGRVIAFAAEAEDHIRHARSKLLHKGVDVIVANDIANMGSASASGWWVTGEDERHIHTTSKHEFAQQIFKHIMESNR